MIIYIALILLGLMFLLATRDNEQWQDVCAASFMFVLAIVAMFRYDVGMDYGGYKIIYTEINHFDFVDRVEIGFELLCRFCHLIGGTYQLMFAIMAALTMCLMYRGLKYFSPDLVFSIFVFLCIGQMYLNCFNAMRQTLTIAFFIYALQFIPQKKPLYYCLCIIAGATFHTTGLILVPLYWIINRKWNKLVIIGIVAALSLSARLIIIFISRSAQYRMYLNFEHYSADASVANAMYLVLSAAIFIFSARLVKDWEYRNIFININTLALGCFAMFFVFSGTPVTMIITRLSYYFMIGYAVLIPAMIFYVKSGSMRLMVTSLTVIVLTSLFVRSSIIMGQKYHLLPFSFNFDLISIYG